MTSGKGACIVSDLMGWSEQKTSPALNFLDILEKKKEEGGVNIHNRTSHKVSFFFFPLELGQIKKETSKSAVQTTLSSVIQPSPLKSTFIGAPDPPTRSSLLWLLLGLKGPELLPPWSSVLSGMNVDAMLFLKSNKLFGWFSPLTFHISILK